MTKTKDYPILKIPIPSGRKEEPLNKLYIEVEYQKGGWSCLTGESSVSGVYVVLTPCSYENGVFGTFVNGQMHTMGYKILLKEMGRKSQKQIDIAADLIIPHAQEIADYYSEGKHEDVYNFIKELYNNNTK